jgi:hypothetical protein
VLSSGVSTTTAPFCGDSGETGTNSPHKAFFWTWAAPFSDFLETCSVRADSPFGSPPP